ncbi:MAG TPA: hypothetical protein VFD92_14870 [Candidatus Binatia bacterium]|nr:hypothetical protein [Candidatus Binatia bacterium]
MSHRLPLDRVVVPWLASRLLVATVFVVSSVLAQRSPFWAFGAWDGGWYADIARRGYGFVNDDGKTPYPFFPLLPLILRGGSAIGLPWAMVGVVVGHLAFLFALAGTYVLVRDRFGEPAAPLAVWAYALFPGGAPFSMVYPSAIFVAATTWAFVALDRGRRPLSGALAAVAALVRPNGIVAAVALALEAASRARRAGDVARVAGPAFAALAGWMAVLWWWTGDPLMFVHAKSAWQESTLAAVLAGGVAVPKVDVTALALALAVLVATWRILPRSWLVLAALWLGPPLFLGMLGLPRYVSSCFPVFAAAGILLARVRPALAGGVLVTSCAGLVLLAARIATGRMMP